MIKMLINSLVLGRQEIVLIVVMVSSMIILIPLMLWALMKYMKKKNLKEGENADG